MHYWNGQEKEHVVARLWGFCAFDTRTIYWLHGYGNSQFKHARRRWDAKVAVFERGETNFGEIPLCHWDRQ